jgi:hypothetical protein
MKDEDQSMFFEVVYCYHPTEFDKVGCDGLYIKEVKKIDGVIAIYPDCIDEIIPKKEIE